MRMNAYELEDFIGEEVIVRNGSDEPLKTGVLVKYEDHHSGSALPIVNINGEERLCFSPILPYSAELFRMLNDMNPEEQMDQIIRIKHFVGAHTRRCRGLDNNKSTI